MKLSQTRVAERPFGVLGGGLGDGFISAANVRFQGYSRHVPDIAKLSRMTQFGHLVRTTTVCRAACHVQEIS